MDIRRLDLFCKVVELKSFTRAAEVMNLSQPSVSEHIRLLEEAVGERLLDRLGREVVSTPAGRRFYPYARRIVQLQDEGMQAMTQFRGELSGQLTIGASTIPGTYILPLAIEEFKRRYPAGRVTVRIAGSAVIQQGVVDGDLEFGLIGQQLREPRCEFERLCDDSLVLVVAAGHPWFGLDQVTPQAVAGQVFIQREPGSGTRTMAEAALVNAGCDVEQLQVVAELGSNEAVRQAVLAGVGVSILSSRSVQEDIARGDLAAVTVAGLDVHRSFYLVFRRKRQLSPLAEAFLDHLQGQFGAA